MHDEDARIDELIRAARKRHDDGEGSVPDEVVHAYLVGRANAQEKAEVRRALARSQEFRRELVALSDYLQTLSSDAAAAAFDAAQAPPYVATELEPVVAGAEQFERDAGPSMTERLVAAFQWLFEMPRAMVAVPAGAALVLLLVVAPEISWHPGISPMTAPLHLSPRTFTGPPGLPRGGATSHVDAAEEELRRCLRLEDGRLVFLADVPSTEPQQPLATVRIVNAWRRKLRTVLLPHPVDLPSSAGNPDLRIWIAVLPEGAGRDVELRTYAVANGSVVVRWDAEGRKRGALFVTYQQGGEFKATACISIDLDSD